MTFVVSQPPKRPKLFQVQWWVDVSATAATKTNYQRPCTILEGRES